MYLSDFFLNAWTKKDEREQEDERMNGRAKEGKEKKRNKNNIV